MFAVAWSSAELESWRESLSELSVESAEVPVAGPVDPMFSEFLSEQEREQGQEWESVDPGWSGSVVPAGLEARDPGWSPWSSEGVAESGVAGDWSDPDWSPWAAEEEEEEALSSLEDWGEVPVSAGGSCRQERPVSSESGVAEGGVVAMVSAEEAVSEFGLSSLPGESVVAGVVSAEVPVAELSEAASSLSSFVDGGRKLREGVSAGSRDEFGDRVDDDGKEARGLLRVPRDDGRVYWWFSSVWVREIGVADWRVALEESALLEGFGIEHYADQVDSHVHLLVRRRGGRLKSSERQIRRVLSSLLDCRQESLSVSCVDDMSSAVSYLTHESAPGKHRYPREEVVESGVELSRWLPEGSTDWVDVVSDMQVVMDSVLARRGRLSFRGFVSWCHAERPDWWRVLVRKASARRYIKDYLKA